jgi:hypothetical protein
MENRLKNLVYKIGCVLGLTLLFLKFILVIKGVNFFAIGYFVLGTVFLMNYYFNEGYKQQAEYWWQNIGGFCFIFFALYYQLDLRNKYNIPLSIMVILLLGIKYAYLKWKWRMRKPRRF